MASSGHHVAADAKHLRVLLPFSCDSLVRGAGPCRFAPRDGRNSAPHPPRRRIPDELAKEIGAGVDGPGEVRVVGLSGGKVKVWCVEVGKDGDGAFLGRGWPEFAAAQGVGAGWLLVLRHQGGGVLTVKAFDSSGCIKGLGTPPAEAMASNKDASHRLQFVSVLRSDFMEKMLIPAKFVQHYIPVEHLDNRMAIVIGPLGKTCRVELEMNRPDLFFTAGWSQFLESHDITEADALLLRYEGNMVFTVKVFGPNGCQIERKNKGIRMQQVSILPDIGKQQETPSESIRKSKSNKGRPIKEVQKKLKRSVASYEIGPPSWIKKEINTVTLKRKLLSTKGTLTKSFCDAIGLRKPSTITLKTSMDSAKSWQVGGIPCNNNSYIITRGWMVFCEENSLKEGDICTFNIIETTLWHVVIRRNNKEKRNQFCSSLSLAFCHAIGLWDPCTITLKTSMSSTRSWQVRIVPYENRCHLGGPNWRSKAPDVAVLSWNVQGTGDVPVNSEALMTKS
ncbi:hypothetical protein U9M48_031913 [Paspalum notatum var. saurae]|uniref:TF-B3 domain-containing protein n=1 Tax=Paspalum notatum var. saurae TaxID=547442 RepID=A0AAQ3U427_PASNO